MPKVLIIESELGWGQKVEGVIELDHDMAAEVYCRIYNRMHNPPKATAPEWYMYATPEGRPWKGMLR